MAITVIYTSTKRRPGDEGDRFVRATHTAGYAWCIRSALDKRYDIIQGLCDAEDLPADVREAADKRRGQAFSYVSWPR